MAWTVKGYEPTREPDAAKFAIAETLEGPPQTFYDTEAASRDPLASRLFAIEGVAGVELAPDSITIRKLPRIEWDQIAPEVQKALREC